MKCIAIELLTEIRDSLRNIDNHLANLDTLAENRAKKTARQARYRANIKRVDATKCVDATKEDEKGKEGISPHTPYKEEKGKGEENNPPRTCARACEDVAEAEAMFSRFWAAYPGPRKRCKRKCHDKVIALLKDPATRQTMFDRLMAGLDRWKHHDTWMRDGGQYIQAPLVWLDNEDWDAEISVGRIKPRKVYVDRKTAAFEAQQEENRRRIAEANALATELLKKTPLP